MKKAVLFITFNRLDTTEKVFEKIKKAQPPRLYLASDGAREGKEGEKELVNTVREYLLKNINWECEVKTRFLEKNSGGCGTGVSGAVSWFFENEEDGIILEDDCVPADSFFTFCEELLDKYKDNKKVWHIGGFNTFEKSSIKESYLFSTIMHCWGWASWRDRWQHFDLKLKNYNPTYLKNISSDKQVQSYWRKILNIMQSNNPIDTWDYQWFFTINKHNGLCIIPTKNMIKNIGFVGVHYETTAENADSALNMPIYEIEEIIHPKYVKCNMDETLKMYFKNCSLSKEEKNLIQEIFSVKNRGKHKVLTILGLKIKFKNKKIKPEQPPQYIDENNCVPCKICGENSKFIFEEKVLNGKYPAQYYYCENCGFMHVNNPTWLDEAYALPINAEDTGIFLRNLRLQKELTAIFYTVFGYKGQFIDFGGGHGILTRLMRDVGFDYYHSDKYAKNLFSIGFEADLSKRYSALTTIETFEHFENPLEQIEKMFELSDTILFTEELLPKNILYITNWWYYGLSHGQHISFYKEKTLKFLAQKYNCNYYKIYSLHILTKLNLDNKLSGLTYKNLDRIYKSAKKNLYSKTMDDMDYIISQNM